MTLKNILIKVMSESQRKILGKLYAIIRYYLLSTKGYPMPSYIQLEPTTKCNCMCPTCTRKTLSSNRQNKDLSLEEFKKIISQIPTLKQIKLQGMGEPLLCPDLRRILAHGIAKGIDFTTISNGTMLSDENIDLVLTYFKSFTISFDAGTKATFEKTRVGADYEKVIHNIEKLMKRKNELESKTVISLNFVATHLNFREIPLFFELGEKLGIDNIGVVEVENWLIPTQKEYREKNQFIKLSREIKKDIKKYVEDYKGKPGIGLLSSDRRKYQCQWVLGAIFITVDGFVTPCCIRMDPDLINFGNIFYTSFKDIWNGKEIRKFRGARIWHLCNPVCDNCPD
jgi:MoaA/NifB/PqqE/SkfB family radical SAM enzyme